MSFLKSEDNLISNVILRWREGGGTGAHVLLTPPHSRSDAMYLGFVVFCSVSLWDSLAAQRGLALQLFFSACMNDQRGG